MPPRWKCRAGREPPACVTSTRYAQLRPGLERRMDLSSPRLTEKAQEPRGELGSAPGGDGERGGAQASPKAPPPTPSPPQSAQALQERTKENKGSPEQTRACSKISPGSPQPLRSVPCTLSVSPPTLSSLWTPHSSHSKRLWFPSAPHLWPCPGCPACGERNRSRAPQSRALATPLPGTLLHLLEVRYLLWCPQPHRVTPGWPELPCPPATIAPQSGRLQGQDLHEGAHNQGAWGRGRPDCISWRRWPCWTWAGDHPAPPPTLREWRPVWVAILTVGSKARGAMTTEDKSCLSACPPTPRARNHLGLPLGDSEWRGRGRTVLMTAQSGS